MTQFAIYFAFACFGSGLFMTLWKILFARGIVDRVLALDTMVINAIALLVLLGIHEGTAIYFEATILIAMMGFVSSVAFARYLLRGNIIE